MIVVSAQVVEQQLVAIDVERAPDDPGQHGHRIPGEPPAGAVHDGWRKRSAADRVEGQIAGEP